MKTAEKALGAHPELRKFIILEHPPIFGTSDKDPLSLKTELAKFANSTYQQIWSESALKNKIVIAKHNLEYSENSQRDIFTNMQNNRFDGIHMYGRDGRRAYTESVLSVLMNNVPRLRPRPAEFHKSCPQTVYKNAQKNGSVPRYTVPVQNRFNVLGN